MSKINVIEKSQGRIFGVGLKNGKRINARFVGSSPMYIRVMDNNSNKEIKMAKTSVDFVNYNGKTFR